MRGGWFGSMVTTAAMALVALGSTNDAAAMGTPLPVECNPTMEETGAPQAYAEQPGYKLDLHRVQQDTVLQSFELYTGFVGGGSAWFVVYEGASTGGSFSLVWSDQVTLGEAGWYASGPVDLDMAANHDYAVGLVATPGVLVYRSGNGTGLGGAWGSTIAGAVVASQTVTDPVTLTTGMHLYTQRLHLAEWCQQVSIYDNDIDNDGVDRPADCDDWDATVYPGAPELCDGKDNDCNGHPDDDEHDGDGDGWASCAGDCDDTDPSLHLHDLDGDGICDPAAQTTVLYAEDFEGPTFDVGIMGSPSWGLCDPSMFNGGPNHAPDGNWVLCTGVTGTYADNANSMAYTVPIDFGGHSGARLTYQAFHDLEDGYDGVELIASADGGASWTLVTPIGGYPDASVGALGGPGFTGTSMPLDGWHEVAFDLGGLLAQASTWQLAWHLVSDNAIHGTGYLLDSVVVEAW